MKTILKYTALAAAAALTLNSCDKVLEQESPSSFDESTVYSNYALAEQTIFSIHIAFGEQNSYRGRYLPWYGFNTDIEWYNQSKEADAKAPIVNYSTLVNDSQLNGEKNPYADMYSAIERANLTITGIRQYGKPESNSDMAYLLGEALTLRAMVYYDLTKAWGDVPARFEPLTSENMYVSKSSRDVIYKQILADLEEAIPYLPYPCGSTATQKVDRVSKVFAEGLYARIALAASGYALRPDDGKVGTGNTGSVRLSNDSELAASVLYPKALAYLRDAINNGGCSLVPDFQTLWYNVNNFDLEAGNELIFCIPFGDEGNKVRGRWNYTFAVKSEGANILGTVVSQGGVAGPTPTMYYRYEASDTRRDITCVNWKWNNKSLQEPAGISTWYFGKFRFDWMKYHPYSGGNDDGIKPVVMRYADILLMAAEIANEIEGPEAAKNYLLPVRSRAFKGNETKAESYVSAISSKEDMFEAIVDERALEFCGEFLRKADLIRWNRLSSAINAEKEDMDSLAVCGGKYNFLTGNLWYKENDNEDGLEYWGLNPDETSKPEGEGWIEEKAYISTKTFKPERIEWIYANDPDTKQFWPIFQYILDNSQGTLKNDYGY